MLPVILCGNTISEYDDMKMYHNNVIKRMSLLCKQGNPSTSAEGCHTVPRRLLSWASWCQDCQANECATSLTGLNLWLRRSLYEAPVAARETPKTLLSLQEQVSVNIV